MSKVTQVACVLSVAVLSRCSSDSMTEPEKPPEQHHQFGASLDGANVVPPVESNATGAAYLDFQTGGEERLFYAFQLSGVDRATFILLRSGTAGQNGQILHVFCGLMEYRACQQGPRVEMAGTVGPKEFSRSGTDVDEVRRLAEAGQAYVEVQTKAHVNGEIRGQLER